MAAAPLFDESEHLFYTQRGELVAAFNYSATDEELRQPRLFFWHQQADALLEPGKYFRLLPVTGPWREIQYDNDSLVDAAVLLDEVDAPEWQRGQGVLKWIFAVWPDLKQQVLAARQSGSTGTQFGRPSRRNVSVGRSARQGKESSSTGSS